MNMKETRTPEPWVEVAFRVGIYAHAIRKYVRQWCIQWHTEHRRKLRPDMLDALLATAPMAGVVGVCGDSPDFTHRQMAEWMAAHIRRVDPVVMAMIDAEADAAEAADPGTTLPLPLSLEIILLGLPECRDAADRVERAAAAHDAAMDALFNPGSQA